MKSNILSNKMSSMKYIGLTILCLIMYTVGSYGQIDDPQIKDEIEKRGLSESDVIDELEKRSLTEEDVKREMEARGLIRGEESGLPESAEERAIRLNFERIADRESEEIMQELQPEPETPEPTQVEPKPVGPSETPRVSDNFIYGQQLFRDGSFGIIEANTNFKAPGRYIVGAGDEFFITIWGDVEFSSPLEVTTDGYIKPFQMPRIYVKGMTFEQSKDAIRKSFANVMDFRSGRNQIQIDLTYSRAITVSIYGEVNDPGSFSFPAFNTAFNALNLAGGQNLNGSVRQIKVLHPDNTQQVLDVYKYLGSPAAGDDVYLQDNDIIFVPVAGRVVSIEGAITRPFNYELLEQEGLLDLIKHAGGLLPDAYRGNIQIERFVDDKKVLLDVSLVDLIKRNSDFPLQDGDKINVFLVEEPYRNFVTINGAVEVQGKYQLFDNMRLTDLIQKSGIKEDARLDQVYILRKSEDLTNSYIRINLKNALENPNSADNPVLQTLDVVRVDSKSTFVTEYEVSVEGAVRKPDTVEFDENLTVADLLYFAGGPTLEAASTGVLERVNPDETIEYVRVNLDQVLANPASAENLTLRPRDKLVVYPKSDFVEQLEVDVFGSVRAPGSFEFYEGMSLKDVLFLSGGLKKEAANNRIEVSRLMFDGDEKTNIVVATLTVDDSLNYEGGSDFLLQPRDQVFVRSVPEFEVQRNITIRGEVVYPGTYPLLDKNERILSLIERAGGVSESAFPEGATLLREEDSIGFVLLDLDKVLKSPNSRFNYVLKDGDVIEIPKIKDLVSIGGAIKHPAVETRRVINVPYHQGKRAKFYINKYGTGIDKKKRGKKRLIFVEDANGYVKKTRSLAGVKVYPKVEKGSMITVKSKPRKEKREKPTPPENKPNWSEVLSGTVATITAILTVIILADNAFGQ